MHDKTLSRENASFKMYPSQKKSDLSPEKKLPPPPPRPPPPFPKNSITITETISTLELNLNPFPKNPNPLLKILNPS